MLSFVDASPTTLPISCIVVEVVLFTPHSLVWIVTIICCTVSVQPMSGKIA